MGESKRQTRERIIDAALLTLAADMDKRDLDTVLHEIFGEDIEQSLEVFASMMRRRQLWDAYMHGSPTTDPPPNEEDKEYIYRPGVAYPNVGRRPVRWGTVTKIHYSATEFKFSGAYLRMETNCGLLIPQLAVILPKNNWHPGSDETCKLCFSLIDEPHPARTDA